MSIKHKTAALSLGALLVTSSAYAVELRTTIDALPEKGAVKLMGTVESVDGEKTFTLRDDKGDTIDVEAKEKVTLSKGDKVHVNGVMQSDFLGFGHEIDAASVTSVSEPSTHAKATAEMDSEFGARADNEKYDTDNSRETAAYKGTIDLDAEVDSKRVDSQKDKSQATANAKKADTKSAIEALPDKGAVTISGKAEDVDHEDKSFTLRDDSGETIDVHTDQKLAVRDGDSVTVRGQMQDEVAGLGEEIVKAKVTILSRR